ncbi:MAG: sensor histidine kinase N-terminal domain-containing protein [Betaproteobacteria bacterium]|nr:sensor histidine kinase N-terminal domain-containing protein [Betaproteobacteria bacterium]
MAPDGTTLRGRLLQWLLIPLGVIWLIGAVATYYIARGYANAGYDQALFESALALGTQVRVEAGRIRVRAPGAALSMLLADRHDRTFYQAASTTGRILSGDPSIALPSLTHWRLKKPLLRNATLHGQRVRIAAIYLPLRQPAPERAVIVQVAQTLVRRDRVMREIVTGVVLPQLLLIMLAGISVWYGVGRGLLSLNRVQQAIANRSHRDLSPVDEAGAPEEVRPLLQSINGLLERLDSALTAQQRFIADAAHQLRTPLAGLKTQTDVALRQTRIEDVQHALTQLSISAQRATRLANQLLALARAEPESLRARPLNPLDLGELCRTVTSEWVPEAMLKDIDLGFEACAGPAMIAGDRLLLREMLANLLDNAIRYTPPRGKVTVCVTDSPSPTVAIDDNGPGIPPGEREHVFQRFHRILGEEQDGSGLGLAIVKEIVVAHAATILLDTSTSHGGTRVVVGFPAYARP